MGMKSKFSRFQAKYEKPCANSCGRDIREGDVVYGTKDPSVSPKGRWFIICRDCYDKLDDAALERPEEKPKLDVGLEDASAMLREFIECEDDMRRQKAEERKRRKEGEREAALRRQKESEARKNIPWTLEWLWEHAEWRWNKSAAAACGDE